MPTEKLEHVHTDYTAPSGISHWYHRLKEYVFGNKLRAVVIAGEAHAKGIQLGGLLIGDSILLRARSIIRGYGAIGAGTKTYTVPANKLWIVWGIYWYNGARDYTWNAYHGDVAMLRYDFVDRIGREQAHSTAAGLAGVANLLNLLPMDMAGAREATSRAPKGYLVCLGGERIVITDESYQAGDGESCWVHYTEIDWPYAFR